LCLIYFFYSIGKYNNKNVIKNILKYNTILLISSKEFEDTKRVIRICKLMKDRKHNGKAKKGKRTNNDLQNKPLFLSVTHEVVCCGTETP
jgi:serine kinase of HPr protein (carbohydrate metabolism regulator)